jgi:hypothetical protein
VRNYRCFRNVEDVSEELDVSPCSRIPELDLKREKYGVGIDWHGVVGV